MTDANWAARDQATGSGNAYLGVGGLPVSDANSVPTRPVGAAQSAYYQVTVGSTAKDLATLIAAAVPEWAVAVDITPETGTIRARADGTAPTTTVGRPVVQNATLRLHGALIAAAKLIASTNTTVSVEFVA